MKVVEYMKWFSENLVAGEKDKVQGIFNYTIGGYSFTTKRTKSGHLSLYDVTDGKVCIATRIYDQYAAVEDSIYIYLFKKLGYLYKKIGYYKSITLKRKFKNGN